MFKKTILIDLDGVLNIYTGDYNKDYIPPVAKGALEFVKELSENYRIIIFTSRNLSLASKWLIDNKLSDFVESVTNVKEPSYLIIDDRCINFEGNFEELKHKIKNFKPWYKK